jgi:hypothetical protein
MKIDMDFGVLIFDGKRITNTFGLQITPSKHPRKVLSTQIANQTTARRVTVAGLYARRWLLCPEQ